MRIVFFGVEELGETCLKALLGRGHDVAGLVTLPSCEPATKPGLWQRLIGASQPHYAIESIAHAHRIPILTPERLRDPRFIQAFERLRPDLIVVACYDKILPPELLETPPLGGINVHPSLLPRHRGAAPVARTLMAGDAETGVSIHIMDAGIDTGDLLVQHRHPVLPNDTAGSLSHRLAVNAPLALLETLDRLWDGSLKPQPQQGSSTRAPFITRKEAHLDWRAPVAELMRTVRACSPHPGAFAVSRGEIVTILEAQETLALPEEAPGTVLAVGPHGVVLQAGDGTLWLRKLRHRGESVIPERHVKLFAVGDFLLPGDWSA